MRICREEIRCGFLGTELDIGLVHHHKGPAAGGIQDLQKILPLHGVTGGVVRRAQKYQLYAVFRGGQGFCDGGGVRAEILPGRNLQYPGAVGIGAHPVHAVGGRTDNDAVRVGLAEGSDKKADGFVTAPGNQNVFRLYSGVCGIGLQHFVRLTVRIAVQLPGVHQKSRGGWSLVGVKEGVPLTSDAAGRHVGSQSANPFGGKKRNII